MLPPCCPSNSHPPTRFCQWHVGERFATIFAHFSFSVYKSSCGQAPLAKGQRMQKVTCAVWGCVHHRVHDPFPPPQKKLQRLSILIYVAPASSPLPTLWSHFLRKLQWVAVSSGMHAGTGSSICSLPFHLRLHRVRTVIRHSHAHSYSQQEFATIVCSS